MELWDLLSIKPLLLLTRFPLFIAWVPPQGPLLAWLQPLPRAGPACDTAPDAGYCSFSGHCPEALHLCDAQKVQPYPIVLCAGQQIHGVTPSMQKVTDFSLLAPLSPHTIKFTLSLYCYFGRGLRKVGERLY